MTSPSPVQQQAPEDRRHVRFATVARGLHPDHVHAYIQELWDHVENLEHQLLHGAAEVAVSPQGQQLITDLIEAAAGEIAHSRAAADADIAQRRSDAEAEIAGMRTAAAQETQGIIAGARQQADTIITGARSDAKKLTDGASAEAAAVSEGAGRRLDQLTKRHEETLRRMQEIHKVVGGCLDNEEQRGSLSDEVSRVLPAGLAVTTPQAAPHDSAQGGK